MPPLAAFAYRHSMGFPYVYPDSDLSYTGNFLSMMFKMQQESYHPNPVLERALEVLFILHADHEQNCSTSTMRWRAVPTPIPMRPWRLRPWPRSGRARRRQRGRPAMLNEVGHVSSIPDFIQSVSGATGG